MRVFLKRNGIIVILLLTILTGAIIRILVCAAHFTHYDDIGLVTSLLTLGDTFSERLQYRIFGWTYAPMQVGMISFLIDSRYSYEMNIILGRLPSLLFSIANLILAVCMSRRLESAAKPGVIQCSFAILLAFSWENIIYSAQAEPYAVAVTAMFLMIIEYMRIIERRDFNFIYVSILGAAVCYAHYQMYMYCFCFYVSIFIFSYFLRDRHMFCKSLLAGIVSLALAAPSIRHFFENGLLDRGINWNMGVQRQFWFSMPQEGYLRYTLSFFMKNAICWFRNFFVYCEGNPGTVSAAVILLSMTLTGIFVVHKTRDMTAVYIDLCLALTLLMIFMGKLTFSPSRHTMVMIPVALLLIGKALAYLLDHAGHKISKMCAVIWGAVIGAVILLFSFTFQEEYAGRTNKISKRMLDGIIETYNPAMVCFYGDTFDLDLIHEDGYSKILNGGISPQCIYKDNSKLAAGDTVVFFSRTKAADTQDLAIIADFTKGKHLKLLHTEIIESDIEIEYAKNVFINGRNGYYLYIYEAVQ